MNEDRRNTAKFQAIDQLAGLMDDAFRIPLTNIRFGLDPLLGLFPGIGDLGSGLIGLIIIARARQLGVRKRVVLRMLLNLGIDTVLGSVPIVGDLFDVAWKANRKNVRLIEEHLERTGP